jgi:hypothetical protein
MIFKVIGTASYMVVAAYPDNTKVNTISIAITIDLAISIMVPEF